MLRTQTSTSPELSLSNLVHDTAFCSFMTSTLVVVSIIMLTAASSAVLYYHHVVGQVLFGYLLDPLIEHTTTVQPPQADNEPLNPPLHGDGQGLAGISTRPHQLTDDVKALSDRLDSIQRSLLKEISVLSSQFINATDGAELVHSELAALTKRVQDQQPSDNTALLKRVEQLEKLPRLRPQLEAELENIKQQRKTLNTSLASVKADLGKLQKHSCKTSERTKEAAVAFSGLKDSIGMVSATHGKSVSGERDAVTAIEKATSAAVVRLEGKYQQVEIKLTAKFEKVMTGFATRQTPCSKDALLTALKMLPKRQ